MSKLKFFKASRPVPNSERVWYQPAKGSWVATLLCAGILWTATPALAQIGVGAQDPRLAVPVTQEVFPEASAVLMLDDIRFHVSPDRSYSFEEHDAVKVLTSEGVEENATLVRVVDQSKSQVEVLLARTLKADGRILKAPPPEYAPLAEDSKVYSSVKRFALSFPDVEPGDIVEFHLRTVHKKKPGGHFWGTTYVQNPMPILDSTFTVTVPQGVEFQTATPGHPESKPVKSTVTKDGVTYQQLFWQISKEDAYEFSPLGPKAISQLKRIEVSSFKDWAEVGEYIGKDWQAHNRFGEGLSFRVAGWLPTTGDLMARATALMKELNRTRRVASFLGDEPKFHSPQELFNEAIVSPADSSILASVALSAAGIANFPVATLGVKAQSLDDELPIPEKINKIILEIPRGGTTPLWFDPENPGFVLETLPSNTSDMAALSWDPRFEGGKRGLVDLQVASAFENREELNVEGRLENTGRAELTVQFDRYGTTALNSRQAAREIQDGARDARDRALQSFFNNTARAYGPRARLLGQYFELDPDTSDPFSLSFTVAVPGFAQVQDDTMLVPLPRFLSSNLRAAARERNRTTPLVFEQPYQQDVRIHLIFPEGSEVVDAPASIRKTTPEAEFVATARASGNEVWYVGRLTVFDPWTENEALQRSLETLAAAIQSEDTILKVQLSPGDAAAAPASEDEDMEDGDT